MKIKNEKLMEIMFHHKVHKNDFEYLMKVVNLHEKIIFLSNYSMKTTLKTYNHLCQQLATQFLEKQNKLKL